MTGRHEHEYSLCAQGQVAAIAGMPRCPTGAFSKDADIVGKKLLSDSLMLQWDVIIPLTCKVLQRV
jgi:hypothetical protein